MSLSGMSVAYLVFGCLLPALVAELYYLLWWKKRTLKEIEVHQSNYGKGLLYGLCWNRNIPSSLHIAGNVTTDPETKSNEADLELGIKTFGEESVESELMRLHGLAGPPRFLFTIKEETKEDLESDDGKSRSRSLNDLMAAIDTSLLAPLDSCKHQEINPLFESSSTELELYRFKSSPPPKFKFLRDAEEKLYRRMIEEAEKNSASVIESAGVKSSHNSIAMATDYRDRSFLRLIKSKERELQQLVPQFPSSSSQVLPLVSSPTAFPPLEKASMAR